MVRDRFTGPFVWENHQPLVHTPHKELVMWRYGVFFAVRLHKHGWTNSRIAGYLRSDVTEMK